MKLFYSNLDEVEITWSANAFTITEYVQLGIQDRLRFFPLEEVTIEFRENGTYQLRSRLLFEPPQLDHKSLLDRFNVNKVLLDRLEKKIITYS